MPFERERDHAGVVGSPLLADVGVLALVPDAWNTVWQHRQQVLLRLARYFHVVWVDPARPWRWWERHDAPREAQAPEPVGEAGCFEVYRPRLPLSIARRGSPGRCSRVG